uniref:aldo-keto reductase family 1 member B1-like n=1 Tax=Styela clava TaxID=7725 RepID=UPI00193A1265|nr:aldo-keto reductase family 1 member B1-like [Styela clava]
MADKTVLLNSGTKIPVIGLGTFEAKPGEVGAAVEVAIDEGYRHIDCALVYENETEVGSAIQKKIKEGKVKREELFITTKPWITYHAGRIHDCCVRSLKRLQLDYVDLYLIHWPFSFQFVSETDHFPADKDGKTLFDEITHYSDVWKEMEKLQQSGLVKAIGVCNFNKYQLKRLLKDARISPAVHQFENNPYLDQEDMIKFCQANGIVVTASSPFGSPGRPWRQPDEPSLLEIPQLQEIADKHGKTVAQVIVRYHIDRGLVVIPKSVTPSRIRSNFRVFDFSLDENDKHLIRGLNKDFRSCGMDPFSSHKYFAFKDDYSES